MIHLLTLDHFAEPAIAQVRSRLYLAFAVGCEHAGRLPDPAPRTKGRFEARLLLGAPTPFDTFSDDRVLYLTLAPLDLPEGPLGQAPTHGFAMPKEGCAVVSGADLEAPADSTPEEEEVWVTYGDRLGRRAVQQMGFLWGLRRCLDTSCAMSIPWAEGKPKQDVTLCEFCRGKSEILLHRARS